MSKLKRLKQSKLLELASTALVMQTALTLSADLETLLHLTSMLKPP
jgi:hypothetical protein